MEDFIPDSIFQSVASSWILILIVGASIAVLVKGADWVVDSAVAMARKMGVGEIIIGATIVSLGTTTPEATVSVMAAWNGKPDLALGNAVGSIICDTALVFGLACAFSRIKLDHFLLNRQGWVQFGAGALLTVSCLSAVLLGDPVLGRGTGILYLVLLAVYMYFSIYWARSHTADIQHEEEAHGPKMTPAKSALFIVLGIGLVLISSRILIGSVTELAIRWEVPKGIIAATLVAFGTSVPELATGIRAVMKGHTGILVGNVIGADILNVLFVIGASAAAAQIEIPSEFMSFQIPAMMIVLVLFRIFIAISGQEFKRWMGAVLLVYYVLFVSLQYVSSGSLAHGS